MIIAQSRIHCAKERCSVDHYAEFFMMPVRSLHCSTSPHPACLQYGNRKNIMIRENQYKIFPF